MNKNMEDMQRLGQVNVDSAMRLFGDLSKSWQAIAAEMTDYTRRSMDDGTVAMQRMISAQSVEQALEIQTTYAKRFYESYMQQMTRLGSMYAELAKDAVRPVGRMPM